MSARPLREQVFDARPSLDLDRIRVSRIWRAFGLQPHRQETFKLSTDPLFVEKTRDIVGLYIDPPVNAMVLCVDEKSQIQGARMTTNAMGRQRFLPRSTSLPARSLGNFTAIIAALNS